MKWYNFKYAAPLFLLLLPAVASGQSASSEKRVEKHPQRWSKLIPTHSQLQYAGGMGLVSGGVGWDYGKNRWETDVFVGFLPRYSTEKAKMTATLKQSFIPWEVDAGLEFDIDKNISVSPLSCGLYASAILDKDFWASAPNKYPNRYYTFSPKVRFYIYVGQRVTYRIPCEKLRWLSAVALFYEVSSNDLYIASALGNRWLMPTDYLYLSLGMKFKFSDK